MTSSPDRLTRALVPAILAAFGLGGCANGEPPPELPPAEGPPAGERIAGTIVVDFVDGMEKAEYDRLERGWGIDVEFNSVVGARNGVTISRGTLPDDVDALLEEIRAHASVETAEPLFAYRSSFVPDDPRYPEQWNLEQINLPRAWDRATGKGVVVAVIDTGIAYEDRDRFKRIPDLDGATFVPGYDFVNDTGHANDDQGHGTHVAGTIAQVTNNGEGVAGVAYEASLMPVKVLDAGGMGNSADIADGIRWAADHGAQVINLSLGGGARSSVMNAAVAHARKKGVTIVAAAGNHGRSCGDSCQVSYPAAYDGVIAVSAVGPSGELTTYSAWGDALDLAAPGGDKSAGEEHGVLQGTIDPSTHESLYSFFQGTSMASPHVAGVAALLISAGAGTPEEVEQALFAGAADRGKTGWDRRYGHGLLDAEASLHRLGRVSGRDGAAHGWRLALAAALTALAGGTLSKRSRAAMSVGAPFLLGVLLSASGLFFLPWTGLTDVPFAGSLFALLSKPLPEWVAWSTGFRPSFLIYSVLPPLALAVLALPFPRLRALSAGTVAGYAAFLLHAAWSGTPDLTWLGVRPVAGMWLLANGALAFLLARELLRFHGEITARAAGEYVP